MKSDNNNTNDLIHFATLGTAFGFGFGAASVQALRKTPAGLTFEISLMTLLAFAIGAAVAVGFWQIVKRSLTAEKPNAKLLKASIAFLILMALAGFLYPLRFVAEAKYADLWIGLALAVFVLSLVGFVLWRLIRFLNKDAERS